MKIGVCGIACEKCPKMTNKTCPNYPEGCKPKENKFCKVCTCAHNKGIDLCFNCKDFPCELTKEGPISFEYCKFISGKSGF